MVTLTPPPPPPQYITHTHDSLFKHFNVISSVRIKFSNKKNTFNAYSHKEIA